MSTTIADQGHGGHGDGHGDGHGIPRGGEAGHTHAPHPAHLAHHFDTPAQQFSTGKLGMWTFLATELLMFGGLFCAYAVYRGNHPEVYLYAHRALDPFWGMVNTIVLLASSFTMAWGVRAAQLNQRGMLKLMLALTFLGGVIFMGVKGVEYKAKWQHHLFPGHENVFNTKFRAPAGADAGELKAHTIQYIETHGQGAAGGHGDTHDSGLEEVSPQATKTDHTVAGGHPPETAPGGGAVTQPSVQAQAKGADQQEPTQRNPHPVKDHMVEPKPLMPNGVVTADANVNTPDASLVVAPRFVSAGVNPDADKQTGHTYKSFGELQPIDRQQINAFFSIYFMMTGLHGIHVLVGMGIMVWLYIKAGAGAFNAQYFTPVDLGGLYWHLVDLIWIFLFPLLYLIH